MTGFKKEEKKDWNELKLKLLYNILLCAFIDINSDDSSLTLSFVAKEMMLSDGCLFLTCQPTHFYSFSKRD